MSDKVSNAPAKIRIDQGTYPRKVEQTIGVNPSFEGK
jgi:hypothetical protein